MPGLRTALYVGSATLLCVAAGTIAGLIGSTLPTARFEALGRPDPLALAGGFALGFAVNFGVLHLLLPEVGRLANTDGVTGSPVAARAEAWRVGRWAALASLVGLGTLTVGAGLEHGGFARGQELMLTGAATFLLSAITWDVLEAVFSWKGFVASRSASPR